MSRAGTLPPLHGDYPPSPPSSSSRAPPRPPLRVNTHTHTHHAHSSNSSIRSAGHSPIKPGFSYNLPTSLESPNQHQSHSQSRARPGGLAAIAPTGGPGSSSTGDVVPRRVRSPPITPGSRAHSARPGGGGGQWSTRRGSNESSVLPPPVTRQGSAGEQRSVVSRSRKSSSGVTSPPPLGSIYSGREGVGGYSRVEGVSSPKPSDLQLFAHHCRLFYFSPSPPAESADYISLTLAALPPSHRAAYTRLQSSLRSLAHLHHLRLRISSFHALISSTIASASLTPLARQQLLAPGAKSERYERTKQFISTWCTSETGGVEPFFRGLWGTLRLQSRGGPERGGGGSNRVVWEIDDAVFLESGGTEFMHEAVTLLKGVLGFDDQPLTSPPKLRRIRTLPRSYLEARSRRSTNHQLPSFTNAEHSDATEELLLNGNGSTPPPKSTRSGNDSRSRASSDPFIDHPRPRPAGTGSSSGRRGPAPPPPPSRRQVMTIPNPLQMSRSSSDGQGAAGPASGSGNSPESPLLPHSSSIVETLEQAAAAAAQHPGPPVPRHRISEDRVHLLSHRTSSDGLMLVPNAIADDDEDEDQDDEEPTEDDIAAEEADLNQPRFRLWIFPAHISDEEAERLMGLFPRFISKKPDVRFPFIRPGRGIKAMEEARWDAIALGTGTGTSSGLGTEGDSVEPKVIRVPKVEIESEEGVSRYGTGRVWVGTDTRTTGWQGGGWFRFKRWWRRLFGLA
ncbi:hypothetical protein I317_05997 [Kwoniella heveanensis CBS 569]|nr:hypothetical protein I317_05997 [Kwoniella heveanensis CBS 569]